MKRKGLFNFLKLLFTAIGLKKIIFSYIGPGSGLSGLGAFIAVFLGLITTIFGLIWYPIKRFLRRKKEDQEPDQVKDEE
jgi:uncharacterized membrane protein YeiH